MAAAKTENTGAININTDLLTSEYATIAALPVLAGPSPLNSSLPCLAYCGGQPINGALCALLINYTPIQ